MITGKVAPESPGIGLPKGSQTVPRWEACAGQEAMGAHCQRGPKGKGTPPQPTKAAGTVRA